MFERKVYRRIVGPIYAMKNIILGYYLINKFMQLLKIPP
jgi:hypothetical protein